MKSGKFASARKAKNYTQAQLSAIVGGGASRSVIQKLESQRGNCFIGTMRLLMDVLDMDSNWTNTGLNPYTMDVGAYLIEKRGKTGITLRSLSKISGVSRQSIRRLEATAGDSKKAARTRVCTVIKLNQALENAANTFLTV